MLILHKVEDDVHTTDTQCKYSPTDHFCVGTRIEGEAEPIPWGDSEVDLLVTDHFNRPNLNNGTILNFKHFILNCFSPRIVNFESEFVDSINN